MKFYLIISAFVLSLLAAAIPIPGTDVWYSQFVAVTLFCCLLVGWNIAQMSGPLGGLFCYLTFSTIFVCRQDTMALICLGQVAFCLLLAKNISELDSLKRIVILRVLLGLLVFQVAWGLLQHFNLDPIFRSSIDSHRCDMVGFNGSHNQYGLFLAAVSPLAFGFPLILPLLFIILVFTNTFSALLGSLVGIIFLWRRKLDLKVIALLGLVVVAYFGLSHKDLSGEFKERVNLWQLSVDQVNKGKAVMQGIGVNSNMRQIVTCNPWLGFGFQKFFTVSPYTQKSIMINPGTTHRYEHAHNDYVEAYFDLGRIGFGLLLLSILHAVLSFIRIRKRSENLELVASCLIAFGVCALSIYTVHTAYNGLLLCVLLGVFYGEVKDG